MNKKVILIYPYFCGISGAYNRYLLLERLIKISNLKVKLIILKEKKFNSNLSKFIFKVFKYLKVESLIIFYCIFKNNFLITDFNPSIVALFSKKVLIQIHDVSWVNNKFTRHNIFFYRIFKFFIKNYKNILTVSKTSLLAINKVSGREKKISYLYNSVNSEFINESNNIGRDNDYCKNDIMLKTIDLNIPNLIYIATITPRKSHLDLLEALSRTNSLFNVNLIGLPTNKEILEFIKSRKTFEGKSIKSKINYFPELSQRDLCNLLLRSSAYISTSMNEGFGIPVLEAQLYNIPLLIRDLDINRELFPNAKFFKSTFELINLLAEIKPLSKNEIHKRKQILAKINQNNLIDSYNYLNLSKKLNNIISKLN
tara:strand:- start:29 stop:1135 length:1107 start_codon:yes stop_codon:yes gene_type:complete